MEIKDYLYLYLGCMAKTTGGKMGKIVSISTDSMAIIVYNNEDPRGKVINQSAIKPILRPLSDMKEDEAEYFAWLCMDSEYNLEADCRVSQDEMQIEFAKNDNGLLLDNDIEIYIGVSVRCFEGAVIIRKDGSITIEDEDSKGERVDKIANKIHYLISKDFDLFGLIDAGLAIDITTLQEPVKLKQ